MELFEKIRQQEENPSFVFFRVATKQNMKTENAFCVKSIFPFLLASYRLDLKNANIGYPIRPIYAAPKATRLHCSCMIVCIQRSCGKADC